MDKEQIELVCECSSRILDAGADRVLIVLLPKAEDTSAENRGAVIQSFHQKHKNVTLMQRVEGFHDAIAAIQEAMQEASNPGGMVC